MKILRRKKINKRNKTLIIGLDGVPFTLLMDLKEKGLIPNMQKLFDKGTIKPMQVSIPEISSVSWSSFMTGTQPGKHGIFGFIDLYPNSYKMYFPNYNNLKEKVIWDYYGDNGKKSIVLNMPATYPARNIEGIMVSGFVAPDIEKATFPGEILIDLKKFGYKIDLDLAKSKDDSDFLFNELFETLKKREEVVNHLLRQYHWDLSIVVITGTDRLMHFQWSAYQNEKHHHHNDFLDYFKSVDSFIGRLYDKYQESAKDQNTDKHFYMLSDHGFTGIKTEVYLNQWLKENGFLNYKSQNPMTIEDIGEGSVAFALDPSRIYINLKNRYPLGTVDEKDYNRICNEIKKGIESLTYKGNEYIAKNVFYKRELYNGPYLDRAPDLVVLSNHGFDLKGRVLAENIFDRTSLQGMHTQDNAFFFGLNNNKCENIFQIKDLILKHV